jgi:hypothetical protein
MSRSTRKLAIQDQGDTNEMSQVRMLAAFCLKQQDMSLTRAAINHLKYGVKYEPQLQKKIDQIVKEFSGVDLDGAIEELNAREEEINRLFKENKYIIEEVVSGRQPTRKLEKEMENSEEEEEKEAEDSDNESEDDGENESEEIEESEEENDDD